MTLILIWISYLGHLLGHLLVGAAGSLCVHHLSSHRAQQLDKLFRWNAGLALLFNEGHGHLSDRGHEGNNLGAIGLPEELFSNSSSSDATLKRQKEKGVRYCVLI